MQPTIEAGRTPAGTRRLLRRTDRRVVGGVAAGLAAHLGIDVRAVRVAFVVLTLTGGAGVLLYLGLLATTGSEGADGEPTGGRTGTAELVAFAAVGAGLLLLVNALGLPATDRFVWPMVLGGLGVALVWRQADDTRRSRWIGTAGRLPARARLRVVAGVALVTAGGIAFLAASDRLTQARQGVLVTAVVVGGLALVTGPYWLRMAGELTQERRARIRSQERAELAAHLHDSVLQTLALIQRQVDDPRAVLKLARSQERELRSWLYQPARVPGPEQLRTALDAVAVEVEEDYAVPVDVVAVGDLVLDDRSRALVQAAREAMVNAARSSGAPSISVYAEVTERQVEVFVRDRGCGFDLAAVPEGRLGIAESIVGRTTRAGGTATVTSSPGAGTEVQLVLPRKAGS